MVFDRYAPAVAENEAEVEMALVQGAVVVILDNTHWAFHLLRLAYYSLEMVGIRPGLGVA